MQLRDWQRCFQSAVLGADVVVELPLRSGGLARELSIGIYANAYRERLHEALRDNYNALHRLLGDRDFADMAYAFAAARPPQTASIRWFGAELPDFLRVTEPYARLPVIAELAQFEWSLRHSVDAADAERIAPQFLQTLAPERWGSLHCAPHPSLTMLHFEWNTLQVWRALDADDTPPLPQMTGGCWFVFRGRDLTTQWRSADVDEAAAMQLWARGENFSTICEFLERRYDSAESAVTMAAAFMQAWIGQGLLVHVTTDIAE